jgi:hypothetical protein
MAATLLFEAALLFEPREPRGFCYGCSASRVTTARLMTSIMLFTELSSWIIELL